MNLPEPNAFTMVRAYAWSCPPCRKTEPSRRIRQPVSTSPTPAPTAPAACVSATLTVTRRQEPVMSTRIDDTGVPRFTGKLHTPSWASATAESFERRREEQPKPEDLTESY